MNTLFRWIFLLVLVMVAVAPAQNNRYMLKIDPSGTTTGALIIKAGDVVQFSAKAYEFTAAGTTVEVPIVSIVWTVDPASFGTITAQGLFTAAQQNSSTVRGTITAVASLGHVTVHGSVAVAFGTHPVTHYTFSGNVRSANSPIAGAQVSLMGAANLPYILTGTTDAHGDYSIIAPAGTYIVRAAAAGFLTEFFDNVTTATQATRFITDPAVLVYDNIDFVLGAAPNHSGSIAGVVTDDNGNPLAGISVAAWVNGRPATNAAGGAYGKATTASDGSYVIHNLPAGDFIVRAFAQGFIAEYYDNANDIATATLVPVAGQPVTGIDFSLGHGGSISGLVINEDTNTPISNATVIVRSQSHHFERGTHTNAHGLYTVDGLPTGAYTVFASAHRFIGEYYDNAASATLATSITIAAPGAATGIDFALAPAPIAPRLYSGNVIVRAGGAPAHTIIEAVNPATGMVVATSTDAQGGFEFGAWENAVIRARAVGCVGVYAGDTRNWRESQWNGAVAGMTLTLDPVAESGMATFSGQVNDAATGNGMANAWVFGFDAAGQVYFSVTGATGAFGIPNTANGNLDMLVSAVGYEPAAASAQINDAHGSGTINAQRTGVTSVKNTAPLPSTPTLFQNYPNPFNPVTTIAFALPERSHVSIRVFDLLGRQVDVVADGVMNAGSHRLSFDASALPTGIYMYRLESGGVTQTRRMTLTK